MSVKRRPRSSSRSRFQHIGHRYSSSGSYHTCETMPYNHFYPNSPRSTTTFQTSHSSFSHHQTHFVPSLPAQISSYEQLNHSETSLDHHSIKARYPEPYSENPFLPLGELRRLRSTEPIGPLEAAQSPPPLPPKPSTLAGLATRRSDCKLPAFPDNEIFPIAEPTISNGPQIIQINRQKANEITSHSNMPSNSLIVDAFAELSESAYSHKSSLELEPASSSDELPMADFPPISPTGMSLHRPPYARQDSNGTVTTHFAEHDPVRPGAKRQDTASSDLGSALQMLFGLRLGEVGSHSVSVCESPGRHEKRGSIWDIEEQNVVVDVYGGVEYSEPVAKSKVNTAAHQIQVEKGKGSITRPTLIACVGTSTARLHSARKGAPPICVENQGQRSTPMKMFPTDSTHLAAGLNEDSVELKSSIQCESPTDISRALEDVGVESPRKLSEASNFSLSLFSPTSTTLANRQSCVSTDNERQHSSQIPTTSRFPAKRLGSSPPSAYPMPKSAINLGSLPTFSADTEPTVHWRSASSTPARRSTIEVESPRSKLPYVPHRSEVPLGRASADAPRFSQRSVDLVVSSKQSTRAKALTESGPVPSQAVSEIDGKMPRSFHDVYRTQISTRVENKPNRSQAGRLRSASCSSSSSVYSQISDVGTASLYSDAGASMTSSVAGAILREQGVQRSSQQSRPAYMRQSTSSSAGRQHFSALHSSPYLESPAEPVSNSNSEHVHQNNVKDVPLDAAPKIRMPPTRKPVPQINSVSSISDPLIVEPCMSLPEPSLPRTYPSVLSFNSLPSRSRRGARKRARTGKITISHPHLNSESMLGAEVIPRKDSATTLPVGPKLVHSNSVGSLRDVLLSGKLKQSALGHPTQSVSRQKLKPKTRPPFDKYKMPSEEQLKLASDMYVLDERGRQVRFGDIFEGQKTAICFIRHFWCPLCQDYMSSIVHLTEPSFVQKAGVKLVIIGNGSPSMIKAYRDDVFHCPYEMYTDPSRKVYNTLGMTLRTTNGGDEAEKGSYVKHGTFTGTMMVLKNALKMPLANAGDIKQLGGEFILGPGLTCSFTSRMHTTRSHTPIRDLLQAAGVDTNPWSTGLSILRSKAEQVRWADAQNEDLDNMIRRGLQQSCSKRHCVVGETEIGELNLGEFRRLLERLRSEALELKKPPLVGGASYEMEVIGQRKVELDRLGAAMELRNASGS